MSTSEGQLELAARNKAVLMKWVEELNKSNLNFLEEVLHEDFVDHDPFPGVSPDKNGYISLLSTAHKEWFPGIQVTIEDIVAENNNVAVRLSVKAKHVGNVMGAKPTGKDLSWNAYAIYKMKDYKIIERYEMLDSFGFMSQLGLAQAVQP